MVSDATTVTPQSSFFSKTWVLISKADLDKKKKKNWGDLKAACATKIPDYLNVT